ncbi:hypothetical protein NE172_03765 [Clostridium botulinum]|uniref:SdpI family protein n=1 Tax=Clostridium botulinum TaxID=1491 RepID=A0A6B4JJJ6_CLOBO|nr:hypothetical protein [Clostridium botulinum]EES51045.1 putative membrane protein [Clostridium botulinum E1 str. 'BoNT E Beluga']MBY6760273.1 hypothetical protein [Clostridium botulinum]MBY6919180.1 hypothetical protein [Clostridium botulinum]MCR1130057.1 hypothetical protein [Clostridium botulinum]NFJ57178.1 hypothetical protein [Clostridium botulinum]
MNLLTLICNILIPIIMIFIGFLYKCNLYKKIDKTLDLIIPIAMIFSGFSDDKKISLSKSTSTLALANKKCSLIWSISGVCTLLLTIILLILNKSDIYDTSVILLEVEFFILIAIFITVEYVLKRKLYKKIY